MSYILDALRKAEAERQRGAVPGLHDQPAPPPGADAGARADGPPRRAWAVAALALGACAALGWALWRQPAGAPAGPTAAASAAAPPLPGPTAPPTAAPAVPGVAAVPPAPAPATVQLQIQVQPMPPAPVATTRAPAAAALPATVAVPAAPMPVAPVAAVAPVPGPAAPATAAAPAAPALPAPAAPAALPAEPPPARLPTLAELPEALRRALPPLSAGGGMYAEQVSLRMVVLNGQVFHEGDRPAPELLVQQIRPRSVVLVFRGQRFELPM